MATWILGDIQGCFDSFEAWLVRADFDERQDKLWLVGDLVNRGPKNLATLRWMYDHRDQIEVVLGNHDLHLLACYAGAAELRPRDTISDVLDADDVDLLLGWLRHRPLLHVADKDVMVHAGIHPSWTLDKTKERAREAEARLRSDDYGKFLARWRAAEEPTTDEELQVRETLNVFTRMRALRKDSAELDMSFSGTLEDMPGGLEPWFRRPSPILRTHRIFFGHWAAIGYHEENRAIATDSGCVWGHYLTGFRREDGVVLSQRSLDRLPKRGF